MINFVVSESEDELGLYVVDQLKRMNDQQAFLEWYCVLFILFAGEDKQMGSKASEE